VVCSQINLNGSGPYTISIGPTKMNMPMRGMTLGGDTAWSRNCAADQVLVGFKGRSGAIIDAITFYCAGLTVTGSGPYTVNVGTATPLTEAGDMSGGATFGPFNCPNGQIAKGVYTRHDGNPGYQLQSVYLDAIALICTTPLVQ
jgi:hypothetical protein